LRPVAAVDVWATDAALFPDGRHVLVRGYDTAVIYTFPAFSPVASVDLPRQRQGEGVSVSRSGRILLSSEGVHSPVLEVTLPTRVADALRGHAASSSASPTATKPVERSRARDDHRGLLVLAAGTALAGAVLILLLVPRRGSRRSRRQ
jgi:hypothetical protein